MNRLTSLCNDLVIDGLVICSLLGKNRCWVAKCMEGWLISIYHFLLPLGHFFLLFLCLLCSKEWAPTDYITWALLLSGLRLDSVNGRQQQQIVEREKRVAKVFFLHIHFSVLVATAFLYNYRFCWASLLPTFCSHSKTPSLCHWGLVMSLAFCCW